MKFNKWSNNFYTDIRGIERSDIFSQFINITSIQVLDHGYFTGDERWNQYEISSPFSRLYYMVEHSGWIEHGDKKIDLVPGKMYLITPNTVVNLRTKGNINKYFFHVVLNIYGYDVFENYNQCYELPMSDQILSELHNNFRQEGFAEVLALRSLITYTMAHFIGTYMLDMTEKIKIATKYRKMHEFIDDSLSSKCNAHMVADFLNVPLQQLNKEYKNDTGITITKYIHSQLVSKASMMLLLTNKNIKEVSYELGFSDEFYFSRFFKKEMNYSPKEYRHINSSMKLKK